MSMVHLTVIELTPGGSSTVQIYTKTIHSSGVPRNFVRVVQLCSGGGFQQIQLRTEGRENGDLGAVAP
jgi:hypothetical protein